MLHGEISGDGGDLPNTDGPEATEVVPAPTQVLVSVPKRLHKRAVARGLIKRRIREAYRLNKTSGSMQTIATMALVYVSPEISSFKSIENAVGTILSKILGNN